MARHISIIDKFFSFSIILLPFLYQFKGIGSFISFGELVVFISTILVILEKKSNSVVYDIYLFLFYFVSIISSVLNFGFSYYNVSESLTVFSRLIFYGFIIAIARKAFFYECVNRFYVFFVLILSIYLLLQVIYYYITGNYLPIYIVKEWQFPPEARAELTYIYRYNFRPSSLFLEPSYYALYALPAVAILLFKKSIDFRTWVITFIIIISIVLSTSAAGVFGILIILSFFTFHKTDRNKVSGILFRVIVVIFVFAIVLFILQSEINSVILNRIKDGGSFGQRIARGFIIYPQLSFFHKLFGVGINNLGNYMVKYGISTKYDEARNLNYCASIIQTLLYSGIVGEASFLLYLGKKYKSLKRSSLQIKLKQKCQYDGELVIVLMMVLVFELIYESILFVYRFAFTLILVEGVNSYLCSERSEMELL